MWKSIRTTNALENLNREFRRRTKTQASFSSEESAVALLFGLIASGQIQLRRIDGYQRLSEVLEHAEVAAIRVVIRKKETRPEAADYGRSNPRNQRRINFLRSTTETPCPMEKHRPFAAPSTRQKDSHQLTRTRRKTPMSRIYSLRKTRQCVPKR